MNKKKDKPNTNTVNTEYELFIEFIDFLKHTAQVWQEQNRFSKDAVLQYCQMKFIEKYKDPIEQILKSKGL